MKQNQIYRQIRHEIVSGIWKPGDKLPTEAEYVEKFKVARNTLRCSLKMLEDEGFIKRVKAKGTFVRLPYVNPEKRNISLLVPCYEYLRCCDLHFMKIMFELIAEAAKVGWRVTPVIFSKTNSPDDIWYDNLAHFNSESRIVINRKWFSKYFSKLVNIGASVAFINNDSNIDDESAQYTSKWVNFIEEDRVGMRKALNYLYARGCRRIALVMPDTDIPENSMIDEYRKYLMNKDLELFEIEFYRISDIKELREFFEKEKIDGIVTHIGENDLPRQQSFRSLLGVSEDFPVVAIPKYIESIYSAENIPVIDYRITEMARDIVKNLISGQSIPGKISYSPRLVLKNRELEF